MKNIDFHPLADIFPLIHGKEFVELKADIRANGVREPIWLLDSKILDGRNRFRAAQEVGVQPEFREYQGDDPLGFVVSLNLHRRHLTESQRAMVAAKIANMKTGDNQHTTQEVGQICPTSNSAAAEMLNVSERSVKTAKSIFRDGDESLQQAVTEGKTSLNAASDIAKLPKEEQKEVVARGEKEILAKAKEIRAKKEPAKPKKLMHNDGLTLREAVIKHVTGWWSERGYGLEGEDSESVEIDVDSFMADIRDALFGSDRVYGLDEDNPAEKQILDLIRRFVA